MGRAFTKLMTKSRLTQGQDPVEQKGVLSCSKQLGGPGQVMQLTSLMA